MRPTLVPGNAAAMIRFMKIHLIATVATAVTAILCSSTHAQANLDSMRSQYSSGNPQRGGQPGSDSSLSPLLGSPPDYELNDLSSDNASNSSRSQTSSRNNQTRDTKPSQGTRISSLYGAPKDYEDSYSAHFGGQPKKTDGARQVTNYGLAAVEGLSSPGSGGRQKASVGKGPSRQNIGGVRNTQAGNSDISGSSSFAPGSSFVTQTDSSSNGYPATSFYRSPW